MPRVSHPQLTWTCYSSWADCDPGLWHINTWWPGIIFLVLTGPGKETAGFATHIYVSPEKWQLFFCTYATTWTISQDGLKKLSKPALSWAWIINNTHINDGILALFSYKQPFRCWYHMIFLQARLIPLMPRLLSSTGHCKTSAAIRLNTNMMNRCLSSSSSSSSSSSIVIVVLTICATLTCLKQRWSILIHVLDNCKCDIFGFTFSLENHYSLRK